MKRKVIAIDEKACTGCGMCIPNCPEGAIQIIDGKARLVSDLMCDGLGACLGHCPEGAITVEEREAEPYDERRVMANIVRAGSNTIRAHLDHLREHGEDELLAQAIAYLEEHGYPVPREKPCASAGATAHTGCPGARTRAIRVEENAEPADAGHRPSHLTHWPIQLHLVSPRAPHYRGSDLVLAADCTAFALGDFHRDLLKGRTLAIACPKLDEGQEIYADKLRMLIDEAQINTLTVVVMQVPCCSGLLHLARKAAAEAARKVPIKKVIVSLEGQVLSDEWV
jgi:NAD-dependent dihydropyrimidine dehydrogenase PreA subunit